jgi:hypothetical protein
MNLRRVERLQSIYQSQFQGIEDSDEPGQITGTTNAEQPDQNTTFHKINFPNILPDTDVKAFSKTLSKIRFSRTLRFSDENDKLDQSLDTFLNKELEKNENVSWDTDASKPDNTSSTT